MYKNLLRIQVAKAFPETKRGRPTSLTFDDAYDCILRVIQTGMQWRQLKPKEVSYITVFKTMHKWKSAGLFENAYRNLVRLYMKKRRPKFCCVDSTYVKNIYGIDCVGRNPTDRGRKATKVSVAVDDQGVPYSLLCTPANRPDVKLLQDTLSSSITTVLSPTFLERAFWGASSSFSAASSRSRGA